ncbi:hypothetical protein RhiirA1_501770 [Rhizophagus irregularis]|uniref:Uncharacterized protein n=1 Tax=Rhizophagus irregularis TaxID=588596 RepID=A0A2I1F721_9GLOM|nr:hypothetical protein RhiirA1_501770 [Rhizophagus irregularis]PKY30177.1 hypothetical protein RhiirB3_392364 [Rhizophagus irregularis]
MFYANIFYYLLCKQVKTIKDIPLEVSLGSGKFIFNTINDQEEAKGMINNHVEVLSDLSLKKIINNQDEVKEMINNHIEVLSDLFLKKTINNQEEVKEIINNHVEITKKENEKIIKEIKRLFLKIIEKNNYVKLINEKKNIVNNISAENLKGLELSISKSDFNTNFSNMLTK